MKKPAILLVLSLMCLMQGCNSSKEADRETIEIKKDGSIVETVRESFEEEYYNIEELESYISSAVAAYNEDFGEIRIEMDKCGVKGKIAEAVMKYESMDDYMGFNDMEIFVGDLSELADTSYHASVNLKNKKGATASLSHLIASNESYEAVVVTWPCEVKVSGKIAYVSDGVEILSGKVANVKVNDEAYAYIIYK